MYHNFQSIKTYLNALGSERVGRLSAFIMTKTKYRYLLVIYNSNFESTKYGYTTDTSIHKQVNSSTNERDKGGWIGYK
jgi:hypothetical protein